MAGLVLAAGIYGVTWSVGKVRTHQKKRKARKSEYDAHFSEMEASNAARVRYIEANRPPSPTTTNASDQLVSVPGCKCQCTAKHLHTQSALPEDHMCGASHLHLRNGSRAHSNSCGSEAGASMLSSQESMVVPNGRMGNHGCMSEESVVYEDDDEDINNWPPPPGYEEVCGARGGAVTTAAVALGR